jgi:hypothetical protein
MQQKHDLTVYMDTPLNLKAVKKTKYSNHTFICSAMIAENLALNKVKKAEERVVVKGTKKEAKLALKGKKNIPEEILLSEHAVEGENITVTINEETVGMFAYDSDDNEYDSDDIQCLSDVESDDDDDDSPVKVKTTKAFIEKVNGSKRKLNLSVEIVLDSKKRKLSL